MFRIGMFERWSTRALRRRMIRRQLDAFAEINPDLYGDIDLYPQGFRDVAEQLVDCRLRERRTGVRLLEVSRFARSHVQ